MKKLKSFIGQKIIFENENKDRFVEETRQVRKLVSWIVSGGFLIYILSGHYFMDWFMVDVIGFVDAADFCVDNGAGVELVSEIVLAAFGCV